MVLSPWKSESKDRAICVTNHTVSAAFIRRTPSPPRIATKLQELLLHTPHHLSLACFGWIRSLWWVLARHLLVRICNICKIVQLTSHSADSFHHFQRPRRPNNARAVNVLDDDSRGRNWRVCLLFSSHIKWPSVKVAGGEYVAFAVSFACDSNLTVDNQQQSSRPKRESLDEISGTLFRGLRERWQAQRNACDVSETRHNSLGSNIWRNKMVTRLHDNQSWVRGFCGWATRRNTEQKSAILTSDFLFFFNVQIKSL